MFLNIKPDAIYNITEASKVSGISKRTLQYRCKRDNLNRLEGQYLIEGSKLIGYAKATQIRNATTQNESNESLLKKDLINLGLMHSENEVNEEVKEAKETKEDALKKAIELITLEATKKGVQHRIFTEEEYNDVIGTLALVEHQQEQIQYLRNRIEKQDEILSNLQKSIEQRNYIEAKKTINKNE
jgi:hypothetical protein